MGTLIYACTHEIPGEVGEPVDDSINATHKLQVLGLDGALVDQEQNEAGRDEGHGHDDEDGDQHVRTSHSERKAHS